MDHTGSVLLAIAGATAINAASLGFGKPSLSPNGPPSANLCDMPGHHQFDFWVGRWDVFRPDTGQQVARSLIEKLYGGCAVRENWMPLQGTGGGSLNMYRPVTKDWRQIWTDSANNLNDYVGRMSGQSLVFTGTSADPAGQITRARMTYEPLADGSVVQTGYRYSRAKKRWELQYQFIYRSAH
jgi:hypothetical protein